MRLDDFKKLRTIVYNHITKKYAYLIKDEDSKKMADNIDKEIVNYINKNKYNNGSKFILDK